MDQAANTMIMWGAASAVGACVFLTARTLIAITSTFGKADEKEFSAGQIRNRNKALESSLLLRTALPLCAAIGASLNRFNVAGLRAYLAKPYEQAGFPSSLTLDELIGMGILIGVCVSCIIGGSIIMLGQPGLALIGLSGLPMGFMFIVAHLKNVIEERELAVRRMLPYALDLLVLCLKSGISMNLSLQKVVEDHADHPVGEELGRVLMEIDMGVPRAQAFQRFADRVQIDDVKSFCDTVIQAEELGWPLSDILSQLSDRVMAERILNAKATAGQAGVMVMLPSALFMIAALLLLFGPIIARFFASGPIVQ